MAKQRVCANALTLSRRTVLTGLPVSGMALAVSPSASAEPTPAILEVIHELEAWQGWEASCVVAAKAYAAYRIREALGMDLPDPAYPKMHLGYQQSDFRAYQRSALSQT